jgi:hypothetical protein
VLITANDEAVGKILEDLEPFGLRVRALLGARQNMVPVAPFGPTPVGTGGIQEKHSD